MNLAEEVQQNLLPKRPPEIIGLDIAGTSKYCDQTGGDYYDYFSLPNKRLGVVVADASGHGVSAALNMTTARAFMRLSIHQYQGAPQLLDTVNRFLTRDSLETGQFMTVFFLEIDPTHKAFRWVRAGHDAAILYDPSKDAFEELAGEGTALGVVEELSFQENIRRGWTPGSVLVIGTDGIWEARNRRDEMFGHERYQDAIRNHAADSAHSIQNAVIRAVESFMGDASQEDDITLVVFKLF
jgi:sigma-B regulation protein RsbU (phosphoserine phosphatase)